MLLKDLLKEVVKRQGSDLHLVTGLPPVFRIGGELTILGNRKLAENEVWTLFEPFLTARQKIDVENRQDIHTSISVEDLVVNETDGGAGHFRACVFWDSNGLSAALRAIPFEVPSLSLLFNPETEALIRGLTNKRRGLVIIAGPTGSGKSTTVASMIDAINLDRSERIFTIEDPVEYVHSSKMSLISQREVGLDVDSYEQGGISAMRADPDVVFLGELRVPESVRVALALADTGHLVFGTMNASTVSESVRRLIESFPENRQTLQSMLARSLVAIIAQQLVPRANGQGRVVAHEIMIANTRIRRMIDEGQTDLAVAIEAGRNEGMCTMDDSLVALYRNGTISHESACRHARDSRLLGPDPGQSTETALPGPAPNDKGEILVDHPFIIQERRNNASNLQMSALGDPDIAVPDLGAASEKEIARVRAGALGLTFADLRVTPPAAAAIKSVPGHIVKQYNIIPLKREGNRLIVAVSDVKESMAGLDDVRLVSHCVIFPVLASRSDIEEAIQRYYPDAGV
jgi:twitching motility protein PilT